MRLSQRRTGGRQPAVHVRERIGRGSWHNAKSVQIASSVDDLRGPGNQLSKPNSLNETGAVGSGRGDAVNVHDILTGPTANGRLETSAADTTCGN